MAGKNWTTTTATNRLAAVALIPVWLILIMATPARAYVLLGEHVLDLMVKALGKADTLEVSQKVTLNAGDPTLPSAALQETVHIRFPYDLRADAVGEDYQRQIIFSGRTALLAVNGELQTVPPPSYARYHDILVIKPRQALADHLRMAGVDLTVSSLGRFEDQYCYVIGARYPDQAPAQLWVAKDTFHPLRLILPSRANQPAEGWVEIRYRNWGYADGLAYPMHIIMLLNHQIVEEIRVDRLAVNPVFPPDLFDIAALRRQWTSPVDGGDDGTTPSSEVDAPPPVEAEKKN